MTVRLGAFLAALALVFGAAALAGAAIGPEPEDEEPPMATDGHGSSAQADTDVPGLAVAQDRLMLVPERTNFSPGSARTLRFRIVNADGETADDFMEEHERRMHLILVRRDFAEFQHLHPKQLRDGSWAVDADLAMPGPYRMFADFATEDTSTTLGADLAVSGEFDAKPLPAATATATAGDGYEVRLASEAEGELSFTAHRNGKELAGVEPYLGADGHLVALREGDLAYLHTHPSGESGGPIEFGVEYPSAGRYRLFLQFKHGGEVRTAAFTQEIDDEPAH